MGTISDIPVRLNGQTVVASWWNIIRTTLISYFGAGSIEETQATITNNTTGGTITGLSFDGSLYRAAKVFYSLYRKTDSNEIAEAGEILLVYKTVAAAWVIDNVVAVGDADTTFVMDGNQVDYNSSNLAWSNYEGYIRFTAKTISVES